MIAWGITNGHSVVPKSILPSRIQSYLEGDFILDDEDMRILRGMDEKIRLNDPSARYGWKFFVGDDGKNQICSRPSSASSSSSRVSCSSRDLSPGRDTSSDELPPSGGSLPSSRALSPDRTLWNLGNLSSRGLNMNSA